MPLISHDGSSVIYLPAATGANDWLISVLKDSFNIVGNKNDVGTIYETRSRIVVICHPHGRFMSLLKRYSPDEWLHRRKERYHGDSRFMTLEECHRMCMPHYSIRVENIEHDLKSVLGVKAKAKNFTHNRPKPWISLEGELGKLLENDVDYFGY